MKRTKVVAMIVTAGLLAGILAPAGEDVDAAKKPQLSKKTLTLFKGQSKTLKVKKKPVKAKVSWKSKKKKVAIVSKKGKVTGKGVGTTKVVCTVKKGKKKYTLTCKVIVKAKGNDVVEKTTAPTVVPTAFAPDLIVPAQTSTPTVIPTLTPTPAVTYNPNWPSSYQDDFEPLKKLSTTFKVGSAIAGREEYYAAIYDQDMSGILQKHYNSTTFTNLMKPSYLLDQEASMCSEDGMPAVKFDSCEKELQFCKDTGITLRAHVLVWYNQTPDWFFREGYKADGDFVSKEVMKKRLESYIKQVVTYVQTKYPGVVYCWDVVNEAVEEDGSIRKNKNNWYTVYAEGNEDYAEYEYVKDAFTFAKKYVEPGVALVYNDYNTFKPDKRKGILDMITYVNSEEKLIDTMGMQCPILPEWPAIKGGEEVDRQKDACMEYALEDFSAAGLEVMITELCVRTDGGNTKEEMIHQAERYRDLYQLFIDMDQENGGPVQITSVTTFGISDSYRLYEQDSWSPNDASRYAWLFDYNCKAKLAFKMVYNVFAKKTGVKTVEETYEEPENTEPQPEEKQYHRMEGVAKTKNGYLLKNTYIYLYIGEDYDHYSIQTDQEGKYSVMLPEGYCTFIKALGVGSMEGFEIRSEDDEVIQKDLITKSNYYWIHAKISAANETVLSNASISISSVNGDYHINVISDENGLIHVLCEEGDTILAYSDSYYGYSSKAKVSLNITQDLGSEEKCAPIILPQELYDVTVKFNEDDLGITEDSYVTTCLVESQGTEYTATVDDGMSHSYLAEGNYMIYVSVSTYDDEYDDISDDYYFLGVEDITKDTTIDYTKVKLHKLTFDFDSLSDHGINVNGVSIYSSKTKCYCAPMTGKISGRYIDYSYGVDDEVVGINGFYMIDTDFTVDESSPEEVVIKIEPQEVVLPVLEEGKEVMKTPQREVAFDDMYSFTPKTTGKYKFEADAGTVDVDETQDYIDVFGELMSQSGEYLGEEEYYYSDGTENQSPKAAISFTVSLEAGKTYYLYCSKSGNINKDIPLRILVTKA